METPLTPGHGLHILHLEDNSADAELFRYQIKEVWPDCRITRVETRTDFLRALEEATYDLILSDFSLPTFDGLSALALLRERGVPTPFLFLSGTLGEDKAVEALRGGALDYVLKDRPARLIPAMRAALDQRQEHRLRQLAEQRLREQAELLDKARDAVCVTDLTGRVTYANHSAGELFGWAGTDGVGRQLVEMFGALNRPLLQAALADVQTHGLWARELQIATREGGLSHVDSRWTLVRDEAGQPKSILLFNTDVTEQKHLEAKLLQSQRLESLGTLAGGIAHDLNNMLAPILMSVNLLQLRIKDPEMQHLISVVEKSALHGSSLIRQVLAFARGTEGERVELKPHLVIKDVVMLLGDTLPRSIAIETEIARDLWHVQANSTQLGQVFMNLGVNARDAMPEGGHLIYRAHNVLVEPARAKSHPGAQPGPHVLVTVGDTGTGIPPEVLTRIFDPFFTTKVAGKGTGLGLSTVLGIIKGHGGFIEVQSEMGRGTEFRVFLPAVAPAAHEQAATKPAEPIRGRGELVLVIDDESSVRHLARAILEAYGYGVVLAPNGPDGLTQYRAQAAAVKVVVVDMMMPLMQGAETIRQLREANPAVGIVAMSGLAGQAAKIAEEPGRQTFLSKPMTAQELIAAIRRVLPAD